MEVVAVENQGEDVKVKAKPGRKPKTATVEVAGITEADVVEPEVGEEKPQVEVLYKRYRQRATIVDARPHLTNSNLWVVKYSNGRTEEVFDAEFNDRFEAYDDTNQLPDAEVGQTVEHDRQELRRVKVMAGRGLYAYWRGCNPHGHLVGYEVVADNTFSPNMPHYAGKFIEAYEGKPGDKTYIHEKPR